MDAPLFYPNTHFKDSYLYCCGTSAISTLTGIHPNIVFKEKKGKECFTDYMMLKSLKSKGYKVTKVNLDDVINHDNGRYNSIGYHHVLLIGQWMFGDEGTWVVVHQNKYIHNFDVSDLKPLEFINRPIENIYVVFHPSWQKL